MSSEILDGASKPIRGARPTTAPAILIGLLALGLVLAALDFAFPPDLSRGARSSPVTLDRRGAWLRALPVENGRWRIRADLDRTDPLFDTD